MLLETFHDVMTSSEISAGKSSVKSVIYAEFWKSRTLNPDEFKIRSKSALFPEILSTLFRNTKREIFFALALIEFQIDE